MNRPFCLPVFVVVFTVLVAFVPGCGPRYPATVSVRGRITWEGEPVPDGRIAFWPADGRPALGELQPDGSYTLTSFHRGDGAVVGQYRVTIKATRIHFDGSTAGIDTPGPDSASEDRPPGTPRIEWLVPPQYEDRATTPLTAEVRPGTNIIDFELPEMVP